jgi:hypothetical protein
MKKKKLARMQRKLLRGRKKTGKADSPAWVTALVTALGAVATALSGKGERLRYVAEDVKERVLTHHTRSEGDEDRERRPEDGDMPNGMVMKDTPGPV